MTANLLARRALLALLALAVIAALPAPVLAAATIVIQNDNAAGVGFNDPTAVAPVGGNTGTTLGQQRLIAFQQAASIWGATLNSVPPIIVQAAMVPLTCTATAAVLGSAGARSVWRDFTGAPFAGTWYGAALANARFGADLQPGVAEIQASFNVNLGNPNCLAGTHFYLGLDNNHGTDIDLVTVLLHEFAHGLGFQTFTNGSTGAELNIGGPFPSVYDRFLFDLTQNLTWPEMTNAQRATSALNARRLVWLGTNVTNAVPAVLLSGTPLLTATAPANLVGLYEVGTASFGPALTTPGITREVMPVVDTAPSTGLACNPLNALNAAAVNGKIALLDRGTCTFPIKVKNAQNAGASGVIIVDNVAGSPPDGLGGADATITIPTVRITQADGGKFKTALATRSRTHSGVFVTMGLNLAIRAGADPVGRALLYTPNPFQGGSSVSHWDTIAFPNQLMEPAINDDLTHMVTSPSDLTQALLKDLGWTP